MVREDVLGRLTSNKLSYLQEYVTVKNWGFIEFFLKCGGVIGNNLNIQDFFLLNNLHYLRRNGVIRRGD